MAIAQPADDAPTIVFLRGEHDAATASELSETIARAIAADESDLVIDMHDVEFMSAATVGVIVRARTFLNRRSRSLTVRSPSRCVRRILALCELTDLEAAAADAPTGERTHDYQHESDDQRPLQSFNEESGSTEYQCHE